MFVALAGIRRSVMILLAAQLIPARSVSEESNSLPRLRFGLV